MEGVAPTSSATAPLRTSLLGIKTQAVEQAPEILNKETISKETWMYLNQAIHDGNILSSSNRAITPVQRRALIVAPQYKRDKYPELPSTAKDAYLVHQMLVEHGYDRGNIRILADGFEFDGLSDPTQERITKSLDWLVEGARPGDYRFFHFAGHGIREESEKGEGKQARRVPETGKQNGDDTELVIRSGRVAEQIVPKDELIYYTEAIVASFKSPPPYSGISEDEYSLIRDKKLNHIFSRLPEGCMLTCVLDCCGSGRMFNNNIKLAGDGFRGRFNSAVTEISRRPAIPPPINTQGLSMGEVQAPQMNGTGALQSTFEEHEDYLTPRGGRFVLSERIPPDEKERDLIKATMIAWSGCHQRQNAADVLNKTSGIFTQAFTETVKSMVSASSDMLLSVGDVFEQVNRRVSEDAKKRGHMQYTQVWSSLGHDSKTEARKRLEQPFVI